MKKKGFTLVELLVVIAIIIIIAGMSLPAMSDFMRKRRLKGAARVVQMMSLETRARAIAQREKQFLVFFFGGTSHTLDADGTNKNKTGAQNTIYSFDSNENGTKDNLQVGQGESLPQFIEVKEIGGSTTITPFQYTYNPDGTIIIANDKDSGAATPAWDLIFEQKGLQGIQCTIDVISNTGAVISEITE